MNKVELILAGIGTALEVCLFILLAVHRSYRKFPFFFAYLGISILNTILGILVRNNGLLYFRVYWTYEVLYVILAVLVLNEAVRSVFRNFYHLQWFKLSFPTIGILMLLVAIFRQAFLQKAEHNPLAGTIISLEIAVGFLQFGLFCLFILLVRFFHLNWRQNAFGIVLGFGIIAAGSLMAFLLRSEFGTSLTQVFRIMVPLTYSIGVAVWLATFLRGEKSQPANDWDSTLTPEQMISELRRHTKAVKGMLGR
jgi:hypothetical protein